MVLTYGTAKIGGRSAWPVLQGDATVVSCRSSTAEGKRIFKNKSVGEGGLTALQQQSVAA